EAVGAVPHAAPVRASARDPQPATPGPGADLDAAPAGGGPGEPHPEVQALAVRERALGRDPQPRPGPRAQGEVALERALGVRPVRDPDLARGAPRDARLVAPAGVGAPRGDHGLPGARGAGPGRDAHLGPRDR